MKLIRPVQKLIPLEHAATESIKKKETFEETQIRIVLGEDIPEKIKVKNKD